MNKVLTINLGGRAYSIEENGYDALRRYLDEAANALEGNPDKDEVMADLETALGEKCASYITPHKSVITADEVEQILKDMGPVRAAGETGESSHSSSRHTHGTKRLYRVHEGSMIFGVCNGLAAYFDIDVTLVRILFVILAIFTSGGFLLAYFIMMVLIPEAVTPQEREAARGTMPLTAQELIDRAKSGYDNLKNSKEWQDWKYRLKAEHKRMKHEMRKQARQYRYQYHHGQGYQYQYLYYRSPFWEFMNNLLGMAWFVLILWLCWWGYNHVGFVHDLLNQIPIWWHQAWAWLTSRSH